MDRFVIREPRANADLPQGNQIIGFTPNAGSSSMVPHENLYYTGNYGAEFPDNQRMVSSTYIPLNHVVNTPSGYQQSNPAPSHAQGKMMSGIDSRYLLQYTDSNAQYGVLGQKEDVDNLQRRNVQGIPVSMQRIPGNTQAFSGNIQSIPGNLQAIPGNLQAIPQNAQAVLGNIQAIPGNVQAILGNAHVIPENVQGIPINTQMFSGNMQRLTNFGAEYQNGNFIGPDRNKVQSFSAQASTSHVARKQLATSSRSVHASKPYDVQNSQSNTHVTTREILQAAVAQVDSSKKGKDVTVANINETRKQLVTRTEKIKALNKIGPRVFSGPVEKVLKWHKSLQEIGILIFYEIVAKCVSIRPGESCAKILVVRDDNGPAMQVVYYEVDFMLPNIKPPCTVRIIGRMMPGTSMLQAFNVRLATGDDVMMLSRRAAVAAHHVAKVSKEYGNNSQ